MSAWSQMVDAGMKAVRSSEMLIDTEQATVEIAETPADVVFQIDKVLMFKYRPLAANKKANTPPVLICYGLSPDDDRPAGRPFAGAQPAGRWY